MMRSAIVALIALLSTASISHAGFFFVNDSDEEAVVSLTILWRKKNTTPIDDAVIVQTSWIKVGPGQKRELNEGGFFPNGRYWLIVTTQNHGVIQPYDADGPNANHFVRKSKMVRGRKGGLQDWNWGNPYETPFIADGMVVGDLRALAASLTEVQEFPAFLLIPNSNIGGHGSLTLLKDAQVRTDKW